jgi:alkanesulfonate monooxygenase SsuD/methylene tetrahydromethanopterin reductase-like flavin-dependent oxidoreductase (luciferase family)
VQIGVSLPVGDIGASRTVIRDYGQAVEGLGFDYVITGDHAMGANPARPKPEGGRVGTNEHAVHDPFVVLSFLAGCTTNLGLATGILIVSQRQTVFVAKQAAGLDLICDGRFRLGVGVGWNEIEYEGLNENFHNRRRRSEEQLEVMRALWAQPNVTFKSRSQHRRRRHRPAPGVRPHPDLVGWPRRRDLAPNRQDRRRLDAARLLGW